jgi:hypothetical protein
MEHAVPVVGPRGRLHGVTFPSGFVVLSVLAISLAWSVYVFADSQLAYVCATAVSAALGIRFASIPSRAIVVMLVAEVGLLGTEANGELASGTPLLGSFRLLDVTVAASLLALAVAGLWDRRRDVSSATPPESEVRHRIAALVRGPQAIFAAIAFWALAVWFVHGHPMDPLTKADVRVVGLGAAMWVIARTCTSQPFEDLSSAIAALGPLIAAKAVAIYLSGLWVIGSNDRLQASAEYAGGHTRIILVGGDTILILIPAIAVLGLARARSARGRWWLWFCALSGFVGLVISGTRSGLIVAVLMLAFVGVLQWHGLRAPKWRAVAASIAAVLLVVAGLIASGTMTRFVTPDPPHVGVNFRADEVRSLFRLPTKDIVFGQGMGGRFVGKDVNGMRVITGWSHAFPAWIVLKIGILGLVVVSLAAFLPIWRRLAYVWRVRPQQADVTLGCVLLFGVLTMSLSLGRAALAEGSILLGLAVALLERPGRVRVP